MVKEYELDTICSIESSRLAQHCLLYFKYIAVNVLGQNFRIERGVAPFTEAKCWDSTLSCMTQSVHRDLSSVILSLGYRQVPGLRKF